MSIMTVFVTFGIGYYLSKSYDVEGIFVPFRLPAFDLDSFLYDY